MFWVAVLTTLSVANAQPKTKRAPVRGSLIEDRAARKLLEAGNARYESNEAKKAVEIWQSVIERYPRSRHRFTAHIRLGTFYLERDRAYDRARVQFKAATSTENRDEKQRAQATLKMGVCFFQARIYGKCFRVMREVIEKFPVSAQVNEAYYYIGLGHFRLGHYSRAIAALEKVGTTLAGSDQKVEKVEAGKRLFIKIEDADLAALEAGQSISVVCRTTAGDEETVKCYPVGKNVRIVLGTIPTRLGRPVKQNGRLEVRGDDKVVVTYIDQHTADKKFDRPVQRTIIVVG
ncbi:MAG: tetratricopeptide repeat protein, partial [Planctomycetes bacterium]|nr:tetratricopeptide repeat protein [Planctomycetota bacterium]